MHSAGTDLHHALDLAMSRGADLLTAGEHQVVRRIQGLEQPLADLYARLVRRRDAIQLVPDAEHASWNHLVDLGLLCRFVPWSLRAEHATVAMLKDAARLLGLPRTGKRADLVARITPHRNWSDATWIRVGHRGLMHRLQRLAHIHRRPDPDKAVVERLGHVVWPHYPVGTAPRLFDTRGALLRWEALADALADPSTPTDRLLEGLSDPARRAPGKLDLHRTFVRTLFERAQPLERSHPQQALTLYQQLAVAEPASAVASALRTAQLLAADRPAEAHAVLVPHRLAPGPERLAVHRTGRRVARRARLGWAPEAPGPPLKERTVQLLEGERADGRVGFAGGSTVEAATIEVLASLGRHAVHAEGGFWRHLFALLFAPSTYFLPVGQLPVRHLAGPLDLGTPAFAVRREQAVDSVLERIDAGHGATLVEQCHRDFAGTRLAGIQGWQSLDDDLRTLHQVPVPLLLTVLQHLLRQGWRVTRGLPDLFVAAGPSTRLAGAFPTRLGAQAMLVELKTPTDALSDAQRWWLQRLAPVVPIEVWHVRPVPSVAVAVEGSAP